MKRQLRSLALVITAVTILTASLTGCGTKSVENGTDKTESTQTVEQTTSKENEPINLRIMLWGSTDEKAAFENLGKKYKEKKDWVTTEVIHVPGDYEVKLNTMLASNDLPDIAYCGEALGYKLAEQGKLLNMYDFLDKDTEINRDSFAANTIFEWEKGVKAFGKRIAVASWGIYYNADTFKDAGIELPPSKIENAWTWDEFVDVSKKLTLDVNGKNAADPNFDSKNIKQFGVMFETWWGPYSALMGTNGASMVSKDGKTFTGNSPESVEVLQKMADLINVYHVAPNPLQQKTIPARVVALESRKIAMEINGTWEQLNLGQSNLNFGIGVLPKFKTASTMMQCAPIVMFASTKHPQETWELYKFLANPASDITMYQNGTWIPCLTDWLTKPDLVEKWAKGNSAHPDTYIDAILKPTLENSTAAPADTIKNFGELDAIIGPALDQVWLGKKTAQQAMDEIKDTAQSKLQGKYEWSK